MRKELERDFFPFVIKPGRYTGGEQGQISKDQTSRLFAVLAIPDLYDFHATNPQLQKAYFALNNNDHIACERTLLPDQDAIAALRQKQIPLFSLESSTPIKDAKLIVFLANDPLYFANCITLLELAGIPTKTAERNNSHPLIVAMASTDGNPTSLSTIVDGFLIGDVSEIASFIAQSIASPKGSKQELLAQFNAFPFFTQTNKLRTVTASSIKDTTQYNNAFLTPLIATANARIEVELSQTNPNNSLLIRKPNDMVDYLEQGLRATGFDEIAITTSDRYYPELEKQIIAISRVIENKQIEVTCSPLAMESFSPVLIDCIKKICAEPPAINAIAGTERLRSVMGYTASNTHILNAVQLLYERGFTECHLSFMLGCPTEEDADISAIASLIKQIQELGASVTPKTIVVHLSAFTPKPHTPYQWDAIPDPAYLQQKVALLRRQIKSNKVIFKHEDFGKATVRMALTRLPAQTTDVLFNLAKNAMQPDTDVYTHYSEVLKTCNLSLDELRKPLPFSSELPWSWINAGVSADELRKQRQTVSTIIAASAITKTLAETNQTSAVEYGRGKKKVVSRNTAAPTKNQVRLRWGKDERTRFMSHLDNMRLLERLLRQAQIPVAYSNAKRPTMKLSHCHPLPLGFTSEYELVEITLSTSWMSYMIDSLKKALPTGFMIYDAAISFGHTQSLSAAINRVVYTLDLHDSANKDALTQQINTILQMPQIIVQREGKSGIVSVDIKPALFDLTINNEILSMTLGLGEKGYARPTEILTLLNIEGTTPPFHRKELFAVDDNGNRTDGMQV